MLGGGRAVDDSLRSRQGWYAWRIDGWWWFTWRRAVMFHGLSCLAPLVRLHAGLSTPLSPEVRPVLLPASVTHQGSQRQHWIDMCAWPVHAAPLEPCLDQQLVGTLDTAAANRVARLDKRQIAQLRPPRGQIAGGGPKDRPNLGRLWTCRQRLQPLHHLLLVSMSERMRLRT